MIEIQDRKLLELQKYIERRYSIKDWPIPSSFPTFKQFLETRKYQNEKRARKRTEKKEVLYQKSGGRVCQYCRRPLDLSVATLDHVTPKCRNGGNSVNNLVICCKSCNLWKGSKTLEQWKEFLINCLNHKPEKYKKNPFHIFRGYNKRLINIIIENVAIFLKENKNT